MSPGVRILGRAGSCAAGGIRMSPTRAASSQLRWLSTYQRSSRLGSVSLSLPLSTARVAHLPSTGRRHNSSDSPTSTRPAAPSPVPAPAHGQPSDDRSIRTAISRFAASLSLRNEKDVSKEESATSSVKKLLKLAKPESKPLTIAVGLVSCFEPFGNSGARGVCGCLVSSPTDNVLTPAHCFQLRVHARAPHHRQAHRLFLQ